MTKSKLPDPKLFSHLQWKPGMQTYEERQREIEEARIRTALTGETITLSSGLIVTKSSGGHLTLSEAVAYATSHNGLLQSAELGMIIRDELDANPLITPNRRKDSDFSERCQFTSTLCLFHKNLDGELHLYVSDLYRMYGNNPIKHQEAAEQIERGITLPIEHELCALLIRSAASPTVIPQIPDWPFMIPCAELPTNSVCKAIFPKQSQRFADFLTRNKRSGANFYFLESSVLADLSQCIIKPLRLGGSAFGDISDILVGGAFDIDRYARGVSQKFFEATP